uniref:Uncharacterized protein n=1 Tax=viral metagenome TaxID=1070528 RepID=A0A6M3J6C2_9ZZZZ
MATKEKLTGKTGGGSLLPINKDDRRYAAKGKDRVVTLKDGTVLSPEASANYGSPSADVSSGKYKDTSGGPRVKTDEEGAIKDTPVATPLTPETPVDTTQPTPGQTPVGQVADAQAIADLQKQGVASPDQQMILGRKQKLEGRFEQYKSGLEQFNAGGGQIANPADAQNAINKYVGPDESAVDTNQTVDEFFATDKTATASSQALLDWLSPPSQRDELMKQMKRITAGQNEIAGDKLELMNINRIMEGSEQDIRDEVTAANGFATNSQVMALALSRNGVLIKKANMLSDQISFQQDMVANNINLLNFEKEMANNQFSQRMQVMEYQNNNNKFMYGALQDTLSSQIDALGWDGMYEVYKNDPIQMARVEKIKGLDANGFIKASEFAKTEREAKAKQAAATLANTWQNARGGGGGSDEEKAIDKFNDDLTDIDMLLRFTTREQFIKWLITRNPLIDPDSIAEYVYGEYADDYKQQIRR